MEQQAAERRVGELTATLRRERDLSARDAKVCFHGSMAVGLLSVLQLAG
jgi:hypothetical protein